MQGILNATVRPQPTARAGRDRHGHGLFVSVKMYRR